MNVQWLARVVVGVISIASTRKRLLNVLKYRLFCICEFCYITEGRYRIRTAINLSGLGMVSYTLTCIVKCVNINVINVDTGNGCPNIIKRMFYRYHILN